jgi:hypothetical protein
MLYAETCRDATAVVAAVTGCFLRAGEEVLVTAERGQVADPLEKGDPYGGCRSLAASSLGTCGARADVVLTPRHPGPGAGVGRRRCRRGRGTAASRDQVSPSPISSSTSVELADYSHEILGLRYKFACLKRERARSLQNGETK